jgi:hypothetical protein
MDDAFVLSPSRGAQARQPAYYWTTEAAMGSTSSRHFSVSDSMRFCGASGVPIEGSATALPSVLRCPRTASAVFSTWAAEGTLRCFQAAMGVMTKKGRKAKKSSAVRVGWSTATVLASRVTAMAALTHHDERRRMANIEFWASLNFTRRC